MSMSPLGLVQERVSRDLHFPWRVLVCCALLNRTTKEQARPALSALFACWPGPERFDLFARPHQLCGLLAPLGLVGRREALLRRMTGDYLSRLSPYECFGVGEYARDALDLFCAGKILGAPADKWLRPYSDWRRAGGARIGWDEEAHLAWLLSRPVL